MAIKYSNRTYENFASITDKILSDLREAKTILIKQKTQKLNTQDVFNFVKIMATRLKESQMILDSCIYTNLVGNHRNDYQTVKSIMKNISNQTLSFSETLNIFNTTPIYLEVFENFVSRFTVKDINSYMLEVINESNMHINNILKISNSHSSYANNENKNSQNNNTSATNNNNYFNNNANNNTNPLVNSANINLQHARILQMQQTQLVISNHKLLNKQIDNQ